MFKAFQHEFERISVICVNGEYFHKAMVKCREEIIICLLTGEGQIEGPAVRIHQHHAYQVVESSADGQLAMACRQAGHLHFSVRQRAHSFVLACVSCIFVVDGTGTTLTSSNTFGSDSPHYTWKECSSASNAALSSEGRNDMGGQQK